METELSAVSTDLKNRQNRRKRTFDKVDLGICHDCDSLECVKTEFGNVLARCDSFGIQLSRTEKMIECTEYKQTGQLELWQMQEMAYIIELKGNTVGF